MIWGLLLWAPNAGAGTEVMDQFKLRSCAAQHCVVIEADQSRRGPADAIYAFRNARVRLHEPSRKSSEFKVLAGYYDPISGYVVLHGPGGGVINLRTGRHTLAGELHPRDDQKN